MIGEDINQEAAPRLLQAHDEAPTLSDVAVLPAHQDDGGATLSGEQASCEHVWRMVDTRREGDDVIFVWECERCGDRQERS